MIEGAIIGAIVGVVMVIIQNQRKKKQDAATLDADLTEADEKKEE